MGEEYLNIYRNYLTEFNKLNSQSSNEGINSFVNRWKMVLRELGFMRDFSIKESNIDVKSIIDTKEGVMALLDYCRLLIEDKLKIADRIKRRLQ